MKYNTFLFELLIILALVATIIIFYKSRKKDGLEGFQQKEKFILKENGETYDDFYGEIYDTLMAPEHRVKYEMEMILKTLQPDPKYSSMLDIGSGTGVLVNYLNQKGYRAYGVDKSKSMVDISKSRYNIDVKCADIESAMAYDRGLFSHIFCMNFTIYEIENKLQILNNCYYWLQNNGYLILHLAEKDNFNTIIPGSIVSGSGALDSIQQLGEKRITSTVIDFDDFIYKSEYTEERGQEQEKKGCQKKGQSKMSHKETFTDKLSQNIRQNERVLHFDTFDEIINMALRAGFTAKGFFTMENGPSRDSFQRIYILERI